MRESALGGFLRQPMGIASPARALSGGWRVALGIVVLLHGLAHANAVIWAGEAVPHWISGLFWSVAVLGYLGAGFALLHVPLVRGYQRPLMSAATFASIALLTIIGGRIAFVSVVVDLAFLTTVVQWTRVGVPDEQPVDGRRFRRLKAVGHGAGLLTLAYSTIVVLIHPVYQTWGTTPAERSMVLPGDELVPDARYRVDHGITIRAPADSVWPWLVQLGQDRGGFYSYAWLERMVGAEIHNADRIHPEWQQLNVGDLVRATQPDYLGGRLGEPGWRVSAIVPGRAIILENWGAFVVHPIDAQTTRFLVRTRGDGQPGIASVLLGPINVFVFEPAHFIMQRGMMRGVRARAEAMMGR